MIEAIEDLLRNFFSGISLFLIKLVLGFLIFIVGFIFGKLLGRILLKMLGEIELNNLIKKMGFKVNAEYILSTAITYIIYFLALVAALDYIGIANVILYFLSAAIIILIVLSFFIALRDFLPNFISGIYLFRRDRLNIGSIIEIGDIKGELVHIDLFQISIKTKKGDLLCIPNSTVFKSQIKIKKK